LPGTCSVGGLIVPGHPAVGHPTEGPGMEWQAPSSRPWFCTGPPHMMQQPRAASSTAVNVSVPPGIPPPTQGRSVSAPRTAPPYVEPASSGGGSSSSSSDRPGCGTTATQTEGLQQQFGVRGLSRQELMQQGLTSTQAEHIDLAA